MKNMKKITNVFININSAKRKIMYSIFTNWKRKLIGNNQRVIILVIEKITYCIVFSTQKINIENFTLDKCTCGVLQSSRI